MLCEAAGSILGQSYRDFELIVVDDGSTDGAARIATKGLEARAPASPEPPRMTAPDAFRYIRLDHTGMPGAVRNRGAEVARGRYLAFLDSDDLWLPQKLKLQTALMLDDPSCRISHTRELWLRGGKTVSQASQKHKRSGRLFEDSLVKCIIGPSTVMIEKGLFCQNGGFREDLEIGEDYELWLKITSKEEIGYLDQPLTVKRAGHPDQLTSKYGYIEHFRIEAIRGLVDSDFFAGNDLKKAVTELSRKCLIYADGAEKRDKFDQVSEYKKLADHYRKEFLT